jgi:O-antigen/teichoic acid export membrane protein
MRGGVIWSGILSRIMRVEPVRRQSGVAFGATVLMTGIVFVSTMLFAHLLGPEVMGGYFLFLAYYGIVELFGDGGIGGAAVKRMSEGREGGGMQ